MTHNRFDLFTFPRGITVDGAFAAGGFLLLKRTEAQAFTGIGEQFLALGTQVRRATVMIPAVSTNHRLDGSGFALQAAGRKRNGHGRFGGAGSGFFSRGAKVPCFLTRGTTLLG
jgi:hypothetical protein